MPSFSCTCGERLDLGAVPNPNEWLLISDVDYDSFSEEVHTEVLYKHFQHMLKCPTCDRLWIFWGGFGEKPVCYESS
jgi:hypothetical protein